MTLTVLQIQCREFLARLCHHRPVSLTFILIGDVTDRLAARLANVEQHHLEPQLEQTARKPESAAAAAAWGGMRAQHSSMGVV